MRRSLRWGAVLAMLYCVALSSQASAHEQGPARSIVRDVVPLEVGDLVPQTTFVDQDGHPFRFSELRGKTVVLSFIYTSCPDPRECPLISANFHGVQKRIGTGPFALVEVTLDPQYDTPERLRAYGREFEADPADWTLLTGDEDAVMDFAAQFDVSRFDDPTHGVIHNDRTALIDPRGRINTLIDETGWSADGVYAQMRAIGGESSNPLARLDLWLSKGFVAMCGNELAGSSGLLDLTIMLTISAAFGWAFYRLGRLFFADSK